MFLQFLKKLSSKLLLKLYVFNKIIVKKLKTKIHFLLGSATNLNHKIVKKYQKFTRDKIEAFIRLAAEKTCITIHEKN